MAGIGAGSPVVKGMVVAASAGGVTVNGLMIVPAYFRVGDKKKRSENDSDMVPATMRGVSISAFNYILGTHTGLSIGIFNYAHSQKGLQLGILNYVKDNPKGLRLLPVFNTHF